MIKLLHMGWSALVALYQCNPIYRLRARIQVLTYQLEVDRQLLEAAEQRSGRIAEQLWQAEVRLAEDRWYKFDNDQLKARLRHCEDIWILPTMMRCEEVPAARILEMKVVDIP